MYKVLLFWILLYKNGLKLLLLVPKQCQETTLITLALFRSKEARICRSCFSNISTTACYCLFGFESGSRMLHLSLGEKSLFSVKCCNFIFKLNLKTRIWTSLYKFQLLLLRNWMIQCNVVCDLPMRFHTLKSHGREHRMQKNIHRRRLRE